MCVSTPTTEADTSLPLHVMAAVIRRADGHILIAQRSARQHQGGKWEFPGGKREPDESREAALHRELAEELGIQVAAARPLLQVLHRYADKSVWLDVWDVDSFREEPYGREGQPILWVAPGSLTEYQFPEANRPIVCAARLPDVYWITPDIAPQHYESVAGHIIRALRTGITLIQLRLKSWAMTDWLRLLDDVADQVSASGARLLLNSDMLPDADQALTLPHPILAGVHLTGSFSYRLEKRPCVPWLAASCHTPEDLRRCVSLNVDFATLSPVRQTASHPETESLGFERFGEWVRGLPLPVYALGGMSPADVSAVRAVGGRGVAGIRNILNEEH